VILTFSEYSRGNAEKSIEEMFGIPNKVAGMWMLALLMQGGVLQVYFTKDKKSLLTPEHYAYVAGHIKGRNMTHLPNDAKPETVLHDLRTAFNPSKIKIEVV
jgi:hypothetical protein